jgi:hypothetical protein
MVAALNWRRSFQFLTFRRVSGALVVLLAVGSFSLQASSQRAVTNADRVAALGLEQIVEPGLVVYHSAGVGSAARFFADEAAAALAWFRQSLGWDRPVAMAVLSRADFLRLTPIPYPSPHAESATGFIIIADNVEEHPGFDLWDLDGDALNAAWMFHELGHVLARSLGIGSANSWINELIASTFMAAYIRAQRPEFAGFQSGMPPRFARAGRYQTLSQFDELYFAMGQFDYLWFHFHIAQVADFLAADAEMLPAIVEGLRAEFPLGARGREPVGVTLDRLESVKLGTAAFVQSLGIAS